MKHRWIRWGGALLGVVLLTAACSATPDNASSAPPSGGAHSAITVAEAVSGNMTGPTQLQDPWFNSGNLSQLLTYRALFTAEPPDLQKVKPDLAEKYDLSADGKTLAVTLKSGLKWSDGQPLTTDDVIWSMTTVLRAAQANAIYVNAFKQIEGADQIKPGATTMLSGVTASGQVITIKMVNPVGNMIQVLAQFMILPKHSLEKSDPLKLHTDPFWKSPVTSGPMKVATLSEGNFMTLGVNPDYEGKKPSITTVNIVGSADPVGDAKSGKIDYFVTNNADQIAGMKSVSSFTANPVDVLFYRYFVFNLSGDSPFKDIRSRQALEYGVDWKGLTASLYPDLGKVINSGVPAGQPNHDGSIPDYTFDQAKAKQLLQAANFDFSKEVKLRYYYADQTSISFMTGVAQQLQNIGMKVSVLKFQGDATTELYTTRNYDIALKGLSSFGYNEWYGEYTNTPTFTKIIGPQPEFEALNTQLAQASDPAKVASILMSLQQLEQQKLLKLPIMQIKQVVYVSNRITGLPSSFGNPLYAFDTQFSNWTVK